MSVMKEHFWFLLILLAPTACGPAHDVVGNEVSVTVTNVWSAADAFPLADQHCRRFGRAARASGMRDYVASFDCVKI
jgi:hypothetical protein